MMKVLMDRRMDRHSNSLGLGATSMLNSHRDLGATKIGLGVS